MSETGMQKHSGATKRFLSCGFLLPFIRIARPDNWFKNVFMVAGVVLAYFFQFNFARTPAGGGPGSFIIALVSLCLVASGNYVINGILDAPTDRHHPVKKFRPIPSGEVSLAVAYAEWILLIALGLLLALLLNQAFFWTSVALFIMGLVYNVPPLRSKEYPYVDVLTESVNNPIRLLLGWFIVLPHELPPLSLVMVFWMMGAFFMASKRLAEYRTIGSPEVARAYRSSFRHYNEHRLLLSMFFYASFAALMLGIFITHYRVELILMVPLLAGFLTYYLSVTLKMDSTAQNPEKLYREKGLMWYLLLCMAVFVFLMFMDIPSVGKIFNLQTPETMQLWKIR